MDNIKEKVDSWYTPKESLTAQEEIVAEDKEYNCLDCKDTGEVDNYEFDPDVLVHVWSGMKPCHCGQEIKEITK